MKKHISLYRILSVLTAVAITATMCITTASAAAQDAQDQTRHCITYNQDFYNANSELCDTIAFGMQNMQSEIDVEKYQLSIEDIKKAMRTVSEMNPQLFYVSKTTFSCAIGNCVARVVPKYTYAAEQVNEMREKLNNRTNEILAKVSTEMSDFQKAVIIHDEIVLNCEYSNTVQGEFLRNTIYDCLVNGYANCQGYTSSLSYLLEQVGINSEIVESSQMNHMWNLVEIDGSYYHIDATFDDPNPDKFGFVSHKYFLLSDSAIKNSPDISVHYGYNTINTPDSTLYDGSYYKTLNTKLCYIDDLCYAADNNNGSEYAKKLVVLNPESNYAEPVAEISDKWYTGDGFAYWQDSYISVAELGGNIYFNLNNAICRYNVCDGTVNRITDKTNTYDNTYIYGMKVNQNGSFLIDLKNSPTDSANIFTIDPLPENKYEKLCIGLGAGNSNTVPNYVSGDINNDGGLSVQDVTLLQMICTRSLETTNVQELAADFNKDGKIDVNDATALQVFLSSSKK